MTSLSLQSFMNEMFAYENVNIKVVGTADDPWFCGKDVCDVLGYVKYGKALLTHVDTDCKATFKNVINKYKTVSNEVTPAMGVTLLLHNEGENVVSNYQKLNNDVVDVTSTTSLSHNDGLVCYINEEGLYSLILSSKLPSAKLFRKWVTKEVLPAIRKKSVYKLEQSLQAYEQQLAAKNEQLVATIAAKDVVIEDEKRHSLYLTEMVASMKSRRKDQYVYIATTRQYALRNRFKIGGVQSESLLKNRLSQYNTGRPVGDKMYYCALYECVDYRHLEKRVENVLDDHKDAKKAEVYVVHYVDLKYVIDVLANNYGNETALHERMFNDIVRNVTRLEPIVPEPIVLNGAEYRSTKNGVVVQNIKVDWDEMNGQDKVAYATRVIEDCITNLSDDDKPLFRRSIEEFIVEKFGTKFKRNAFWPFIKLVAEAKGVIVKYR